MALKFTDLLWLPGGEKGHVVAADGKRACHVFQTQPRLEKEAPGDDSACATASNRDRGWRRSGGRPHGECGGCWRRGREELPAGAALGVPRGYAHDLHARHRPAPRTDQRPGPDDVVPTVVLGARRNRGAGAHPLRWAAPERRDRLRSEERRVGKECRSRWS